MSEAGDGESILLLHAVADQAVRTKVLHGQRHVRLEVVLEVEGCVFDVGVQDSDGDGRHGVVV